MIRLAFLAGLVVIGAASYAWAHGDAAWIMSDPNTRFCCGPTDCAEVEATATDAGWAFEHPEDEGVTKLVPYERTQGRFPSKDEHFWACLNLHGTGKPVRCIFVPQGGA